MKRSIKFQVFFLISLVAVVFVAVISLLNALFYDDYYLYQKKNALVSLYNQTEAAYVGEAGELQPVFNHFETKYGIRIRVVSGYYLVYDTNYTRDNFFSFRQNQEHQAALSSGLFYAFDEEEYRENGYSFMTTKDGDYQNEYVCLLGGLSNGDILVASIPVAMLEENVSFSSLFVTIAGLLALAVCLVLAGVISQRFTRPIIALSDIATSMATLDFSKKYQGQTEDEIGQLGENINRLSYQLNKAIAELRQTNASLEEEIRQKEKIDHMRKEFLINASHELKTPVALIQGYAEGLKMGINSREDTEFYCDTIIEEAAHMNKLVMQLLDLSRLELGNSAPKRALTDGDELAEHVCRRLEHAAREKGLTIEREPVGTVWCDEEMLEQVLTNFLSNAIRHTKTGGRIRLYGAEENGACKVAVYNDGLPIPEDAMEMLWEKFYKIDKAHTRTQGGTGIGLSIVRAIAIAHGGGYGVRNLEHGVEFYVLFPDKGL